MARPLEAPIFQQFGRYTSFGLIRRWTDHGRLKNPTTLMLVVCECGTGKFVNAQSVVSGRATSCGCSKVGEDLTGKRFGMLEVIAKSHSDEKHLHYRCRCDCGAEIVTRSSRLKGGSARSCGCAKVVEMEAGERFGKLTVLGPDPSKKGKAHLKGRYWRVRCDCGTETSVSGGSMRFGSSRSCGCQSREHFMPKTHDLSKTPHYQTWRNMLSRCYDPDDARYASYGGRGIEVCSRWRFGDDGKLGIECFYADMGERPEGHSIDRIDVNKGYAPSNCRWADKRVQANNTRRNVWLIVLGQNLTLANCARVFKVNYSGLRKRIKRGLDVHDALRAMGVHLPKELQADVEAKKAAKKRSKMEVADAAGT